MPYYQRRRTYGGGRRTSYRKLDKKINRVRRMIPKPEYKLLNGNFTFLADVVGTVFYPFLLAQGVGDGQRVGTETVLRSIQIRGTIEAIPTFVNTFVRVIVGLDREPDSTAAIPAAIIRPVGSGTLLRGPREKINSERFKIWSDRTYSFRVNEKGNHFYKFYKSVKIPQEWEGGAATTGAMVRNHWFIMVCSNEATTYRPDCDFTFQCYFTDV